MIDGSHQSCTEHNEMLIFEFREESIVIALGSDVIGREEMEVDDTFMDYV